MRVGLTALAVFGLLVSQTAAFAQSLPVEHRLQGGGPSLPLGPDNPEWMAGHFVNIGQGAGAIFEFSCGLIVVDTGGQKEGPVDNAERFASYLDSVFARRPDLNRTIDVVYITHPHTDHALGIDKLIEGDRFRIRHVVTSAIETGSGRFDQRDLIRWANQHLVPAVQIRTSMLSRRLGLTSRYLDPLRCRGSDPSIRVLWGRFDESHHWPQGEETDENNHSVAIRIAFNESSFLVVGDMEQIAQRAMVARYVQNKGVLNTDVYVVGHHGSSNGTSAELVEKMTPELAVISAGNPAAREPFDFAAFNFGHPNQEAIRLISDPANGVSMTRPPTNVGVGIKGRNRFTGAPPEFEMRDIDKAIFSTGWDGTVVVLANANGEKRVIID